MCNSPTDPKNVLWIALAEKAYAQWNETGNELGRGNSTGNNDYASIGGGSPYYVDEQVLGRDAYYWDAGQDGWSLTGSDKQVLINAITSKMAVSTCTIGTPDPSTNLVGGHCYNICGYNSSSDTFTLFNPWNSDQPPSLTWADLEANLGGFIVANPLPTPPVISSPAAAADALRASLQIVPALGGPSIAASKQIVGWDKPGAVPPRFQAIHGGTALRCPPYNIEPGQRRLAHGPGVAGVAGKRLAAAGFRPYRRFAPAVHRADTGPGGFGTPPGGPLPRKLPAVDCWYRIGRVYRYQRVSPCCTG